MSDIWKSLLHEGVTAARLENEAQNSRQAARFGGTYGIGARLIAFRIPGPGEADGVHPQVLTSQYGPPSFTFGPVIANLGGAELYVKSSWISLSTE